MPCSCDGMDTHTIGRLESELEREHVLRCQAQSLAHKLGLLLERAGIPMREHLIDRLEEHRASLLKHKREENNADVAKAERALRLIQQRVHDIRRLGGEPSQTLQDEAIEAARVIRDTRMTDEQLMGVPE